MNKMNIVNLKGVEMYEDEALELMENGMYIVTFSNVIQIAKKKNGALYGKVVYHKKVAKGEIGLARRGRFYTMPFNRINEIIGMNLVENY